MANCWVKFVCPFTSVIVPAANNNNALKSRPFNGNSFTFWLETFSPPVPLAGFEVVLGFRSEERRVGKECRSRGGADLLGKKNDGTVLADTTRRAATRWAAAAPVAI